MEKSKVVVSITLYHDRWALNLALRSVSYSLLLMPLPHQWILSVSVVRLMIYWVSKLMRIRIKNGIFVSKNRINLSFFRFAYTQKALDWKSLTAVRMIFALLVPLRWLLWFSFAPLAWNGRQKHRISCWPSSLRLFSILSSAALLVPLHRNKRQKDSWDLVVSVCLVYDFLIRTHLCGWWLRILSKIVKINRFCPPKHYDDIKQFFTHSRSVLDKLGPGLSIQRKVGPIIL